MMDLKMGMLVAVTVAFLSFIVFPTDLMAECGKKNLWRQIAGKDICMATNKAGKTAEKAVRKVRDVAKKVVKEASEEVSEVICTVGSAIDSDAECNVASIGVSVNSDGKVGVISDDGKPPEKMVSLISSKEITSIHMAFLAPDDGGIALIQLAAPKGTYDPPAELDHGLVCHTDNNICGDATSYDAEIGRTPSYIESPIEMTSLAMGVDEMRRIHKDDPWWHYVIVGGGIAADLFAMAVPAVPGGAGFIAKSYRMSIAENAAKAAGKKRNEMSLLVKATFVPSEALRKIPEGWTLSPAKKGIGIRFHPRDYAGTHIRFKTDANPLDPTTWTVRAQIDGQHLNARGEVLDTKKSTEAHFSVEEFNKLFPLDRFPTTNQSAKL